MRNWGTKNAPDFAFYTSCTFWTVFKGSRRSPNKGHLRPGSLLPDGSILMQQSKLSQGIPGHGSNHKEQSWIQEHRTLSTEFFNGSAKTGWKPTPRTSVLLGLNTAFIQPTSTASVYYLFRITPII